jgi:hypothetical protein
MKVTSHLFYYIPKRYHAMLKSMLPEGRKKDENMTSLIQEAINRQLQADLILLHSLGIENLQDQSISAQILKHEFICEKCLTKNTIDRQIRIEDHIYCSDCVLYQIKDLMTQIIHQEPYRFDLFKRVLQFLSPAFFTERKQQRKENHGKHE